MNIVKNVATNIARSVATANAMDQGFPNWWARPHLRARGFSEWARDFLKM